MRINDSVEDEYEEICLSDDENSVPKIKTNDVIKALNVCIDYATDHISFEKIVALQDIKESAINKKFTKSKAQAKISNFLVKTSEYQIYYTIYYYFFIFISNILI